jgi:hypothetical protein
MYAYGLWQIFYSLGIESYMAGEGKKKRKYVCLTFSILFIITRHHILVTVFLIYDVLAYYRRKLVKSSHRK